MSDILARKDGKTAQIINNTENHATNSARVLVTNAEITKSKAIQDGFKTIINCRWCGGKSKEIYIPALKSGKNNKPAEIIYDYEPCEKCKKEWKSMIVILEITEQELYKDCLPIDEVDDIKLYPTGRQIGITEQAAKEGIDKNAKNGMVFFMDKEMFSDIFKKYFND